MAVLLGGRSPIARSGTRLPRPWSATPDVDGADAVVGEVLVALVRDERAVRPGEVGVLPQRGTASDPVHERARLVGHAVPGAAVVPVEPGVVAQVGVVGDEVAPVVLGPPVVVGARVEADPATGAP